MVSPTQNPSWTRIERYFFWRKEVCAPEKGGPSNLIITCAHTVDWDSMLAKECQGHWPTSASRNAPFRVDQSNEYHFVAPASRLARPCPRIINCTLHNVLTFRSCFPRPRAKSSYLGLEFRETCSSPLPKRKSFQH